MGTVYLALDRKHGRRVAIKLLPPEVAAALGPERFLREIGIAARLSHPNILPLHDSGQSAGVLYYVMPYVEGESLRHRLEHDGQLPLEEALQLTRGVAAAWSMPTARA
jgi:eukaryotic-like serine/threonine-protein kinase